MYFLPEIVQLHLPECFRKKYSTTTLIIDATEIYIEKPNNPEAQQVTFSSYKHSNTLKALVGIVPKGGFHLFQLCMVAAFLTRK